MRRHIEEPVILQDEPFNGTRETHPAYGMIGANRVSGTTPLFGSDFMHHNYVQITIRRAERNRNLSTDWYHGRDELIEVSISEGQWATFVSSMNVGFGVPCTINHIDRKGLPGLPEPPSRTEEFAAELSESQEKARQSLVDLSAAIAASGLSGKKQKELLDKVDTAQRQMGPNAQFVAGCFDEHMEQTVERAKIEVNAYAMAVLHGRSSSLTLGAGAGQVLLEARESNGIKDQDSA